MAQKKISDLVAVAALLGDADAHELSQGGASKQAPQVVVAGSSRYLIQHNLSLSFSVGASALTIAIKTSAGVDPAATSPVVIPFRSATASAGTPTRREVNAATSLVISSGSTLGTVNSTPFRLWIVAFDDAGTVRLGVINCLSGTNIYPLAVWGIASSTAEGGAGGADSAQTFYTGAAVTSKPYIVLGYATWESGLATAGTWSAGPTRVQLYSPDVPLPGRVVQMQRTDTGANASGTTTIPYDDTIPQNTEGTQFMSQAITPTSAANVLHARAQAMLRQSSVNTVVAGALFQSGSANALAVDAHFVDASANQHHHMSRVAATMKAGGTSAITFSYRAGPHTAATVYFNATTAPARLYGGVANSFLEVEEIMA